MVIIANDGKRYRASISGTGQCFIDVALRLG